MKNSTLILSKSLVIENLQYPQIILFCFYVETGTVFCHFIHFYFTPTWQHSFSVSEEIQKVLGFDWLLLFIQPHVHRSTVIIALRILLNILQNQTSMQRFREGIPGGGWLSNTEPVLKQHVGVMLGKTPHLGGILVKSPRFIVFGHSQMNLGR